MIRQAPRGPRSQLNCVMVELVRWCTPVGNRPDSASEPERFLYCPKCNAIGAKAETLGRTVVYVRCRACGEAWSIPERRKTSRENNRAARFPLPD